MLFVLFVVFGTALATDNYIIGGDDVTEEGKWSWMGSMRTYGHMCGISLISSKWGVTAAHCVDGEKPSDITFMFGTNDRTDGLVVVGVSKIIKHESYGLGEGLYPNDIAVVEFNAEVQGPNISPVPLTEAGKDHAGNKDCWITGWGLTSSGGVIPKILQEAQVNVYTQDECKEVWGSDINDGHVCIGDSVNKRTSCNGDSGGPLVCTVNGRYELVGATSWGISKCYTFVPAGYTRISYFRDWIKTNTGV